MSKGTSCAYKPVVARTQEAYAEGTHHVEAALLNNNTERTRYAPATEPVNRIRANDTVPVVVQLAPIDENRQEALPSLDPISPAHKKRPAAGLWPLG